MEEEPLTERCVEGGGGEEAGAKEQARQSPAATTECPATCAERSETLKVAGHGRGPQQQQAASAQRRQLHGEL